MKIKEITETTTKITALQVGEYTIIVRNGEIWVNGDSIKGGPSKHFSDASDLIVKLLGYEFGPNNDFIPLQKTTHGLNVGDRVGYEGCGGVVTHLANDGWVKVKWDDGDDSSWVTTSELSRVL